LVIIHSHRLPLPSHPSQHLAGEFGSTLFGNQPYNININPSQNRLVSLLAVGEGHHTFPYNYSASEWQWTLNFTTMFINIMAFVGMAYGRKSVSKEMLEVRMKRTGLGTEKKMSSEREEMSY
jgi:hypothetical protein